VQIEDVEIALLRQEGVLQTAIKDQPGADGEVLLLAYVVLREGASTTTEELMSGLRVILPEYMLPARIILVQSLPQSSSGKVDKSALTELQPHLYQREYEPPQNDLETRLAAMWETILDIQPIGRNADFFSLGGTSLAAMRLFAWIERDFGTMLPMTVLFGSPTIADLADQLKQGDDGTRWSPLVAVQSNGDLPPFFCVSPLVVDVLAYRGLALEMGSDQPFYALYAHRYERPGQEHMRGTIERLADQYVQEIRNLQQQGPYYIGGYSFGGRVAYEMARQLHADGERVALLALLETFAPGYLRDIPYLPKKLNRRIRNLPRIGDSFTNVGPWARMHFQILRDLDMRGKEAYLRVKLAARMREMRRRILKTVPRRQEATNLDAGVAIPDPNLPEYEPGTYEGKVAIFRAARQMIGVRRDPTMGWGSRISGDIEVHTVPGFHDSILFGPRLLHLAELLNESLAAARVAAAND
jgi:thioesterase domain-containing protein